MTDISGAARKEIDHRDPIWLDDEDENPRDKRYRSGFIAGAQWGYTRFRTDHEQSSAIFTPPQNELKLSAVNVRLQRELNEALIELADLRRSVGDLAREQMAEQIAQIIDSAPIDSWPTGRRIVRDPKAAARAVFDAISALGVAGDDESATALDPDRETIPRTGRARKEDPPGATQTSPVDWAEAKWMMVVNDGNWTPIAENVSSSTLTQLRLGKNKLFRDDELAHFEFAGRKPESPAVKLHPNRTNLWGRYTQNITFRPATERGRFRVGEALATPLSRPFPSLFESNISHWEADKDHFDSDESVEAEISDCESIPLATADRLPGSMRTHVLRDGLWLVGYPRTRPDGSGETTIVAKSNTGETLASFALSRRVVRAFSSFTRENIIVLDEALNVAVFGILGDLISEFSLADTPEVRSVTDVVDVKATAMLRGVDISPLSGDIAFSVLDYVWRFTSEGQPISAFRFWDNAKAYPNGFPRSVSQLVKARALQALHEQMFEKSDRNGRDWIYFLRFSDRDDSLYVSTYSGYLINIPRFEIHESRWALPSVTEDILETDNGLVVSGWYGACYIDPDGVVEEFHDYTGVFHSGSLLVGMSEAFNPVSRTGVRYNAERKIRGMYPIDGRMRVEMDISYFDFDLP